MDIKEIFALRLRKYILELVSAYEALKRVEGYEDDDFSPSAYTPSRNQSTENVNKMNFIIQGYCIAVDDYLERDHGITESKVMDTIYPEVNKGLLFPKSVDVDSGFGYPPSAIAEAESDAIKKFHDYLFGEKEKNDITRFKRNAQTNCLG